MLSCCGDNGRGKKNWHEKLLVNNLHGQTEHVQPTKTIQLQAPRLRLSARAWHRNQKADSALYLLDCVTGIEGRLVAETPIVLPPL